MQDCGCACGGSPTTIESYLRGKAKETLPDEAVMSILMENGVEPGTEYACMTDRQRDLCLAGLYVYLADPMLSKSVKDSDADWSHSESTTSSAYGILHYLRMANAIYKKYGLPTVGDNKWGMRGGGFHNMRNYGNSMMY